MALTVDIGDATLKLKTGAGFGAEFMDGLGFFVGKGTSNVSTCLYLRNSQDENVFTRAADAQTSLEVASTQPA